MDALLAAGEWLAIVIGGLVIRFAAAVAFLAAAVAVLLPVVYAFEGGRRLLRRLRGIEDLLGFEWRRTPRYAPSHLWLGERGQVVRIGVDAIAARLLLGSKRIELPPIGSEVKSGTPLVRFLSPALATALATPIDGIVERVNARLEDDPALATAHPYGDGWLLEVRPRTREFRQLPRRAEARAWFRADAMRLTHALEHASGYAAADGGVPTAPHHQLLGDEELAALTRQFLHAEVESQKI